MNLRMYREALLTAIERRANCSAAFLHTQPVKISRDGMLLWTGKVEVFQLKNHPQANHAYAWSFQNDQGKTEYVTVVGIPPLDNPLSAVKAFLAAKDKE